MTRAQIPQTLSQLPLFRRLVTEAPEDGSRAANEGLPVVDAAQEALGAVLAAQEVDLVYVGISRSGLALAPTWLNLPEEYNATNRPWYRVAIGKRGLAFTDPYLDLAGDEEEYVVSASHPVQNLQGQIAGVAAVDFRLDTVREIIEERSIQAGEIYQLTRSGRVIYHPALEQDEPASPPGRGSGRRPPTWRSPPRRWSR